MWLWQRLSVCRQNNSKSPERIWVQFSGNVPSVPKTSSLNPGDVQDSLGSLTFDLPKDYRSMLCNIIFYYPAVQEKWDGITLVMCFFFNNYLFYSCIFCCWGNISSLMLQKMFYFHIRQKHVFNLGHACLVRGTVGIFPAPMRHRARRFCTIIYTQQAHTNVCLWKGI